MSLRSTWLVAASLAAAPAVALIAQTPPAASPYAAVRGYVFDSLLTNTTLPNAVVILSGSVGRSVSADARGRFSIDSLPPGAYTITFSHQSLDEVGYSAPQWSLDLKAGVTSRVFLSTTSGEAIYAKACPGARAEQTGAVLGSLREVNTQKPIAEAEVRVEWSESSVSKELGITRRLKAVRSPTDSLGRFRLCGVPNEAGVLLRAKARGFDGPPLELVLNGRSLAIRTLSLDLKDSVARAANNGVVDKGTATLRGRVQQEDGKPLGEAQVLVLGLPTGAQSSAAGTFEMTGLPGGTHTVEVRAIGYGRKREMIELHPDQPTELNVKLVKVAAILPELSVNAKANANMAEFDKNKEHGMGHFITESDIARRNPLRTEDLFRTVPGLSVVPSGGFDYTVVSTRGTDFNGQCSPDFYIDGAKVTVDPMIGGGIPVNPSEIYGIEVYNGAATTPAQYMTQNGCGAIVIWTKRGGPQKRR